MKLFAYGTLQSKEKQMELFGRILVGNTDTLNNYIKSTIEIQWDFFDCIYKSNNKKVKGCVYDLNNREILTADKYEGNEYKRIKVCLESGNTAWVYIDKLSI